MRKALLYIAAAFFVVIAIGFAAAAFLLDAEALSATLADQASLAIGEPVELGEVELVLFPTPGARVRSVVVGRASGPLAQVEEIRARVSLLALLFGQVVLRSLELDAPQVDLDQLTPSAGRAPEAPRDRRGAAEPGEESEPPMLAVSSLVIRDGDVKMGEWQVRELVVDGSLSLDGSGAFAIAANVPGAGNLRDVEVDVSDPLGAQVWTATGRIEDIELGGLAERLALAMELAGGARVDFAAGGVADEINALDVAVAASAVALRSEEFALDGDVEAKAIMGQGWEIDLHDAELRQGEVLRKPRGEALHMSGELMAELGPGALRSFELEVGPNELFGNIDLTSGTPRITLEDSAVELALIADWFIGEVRPTSGAVSISRWVVALDPLDVSGDLNINALDVVLPDGQIQVSGPVRGEGPRIVAAPLEVSAGGQPAEIAFTYELASGNIELVGDVASAQVEPLLRALMGDANLTGLLVGNIEVRGPPDDVAGLRGGGSFEISQGQVRGLSVMKSILGQLSAIPVLVARAKGRDLSRFEEEEFQRLAIRFRLRNARALVDELVLEYRHATVDLKGSVGLVEGDLDLEGKLTLGEELDAELADTERGQKRVIPIAGVRGTLERPTVVLDRRAVAAALTTYATGGKVRDALEEQLGEEGADAVQDVLEQLFRGGKQR